VGHAYFINFTANVLATDSTMLTPASFRYPSSGAITSAFIRPVPGVKAGAPAPNPVGGNGNGGSNNGGNGPKGPQPQPVGGHQPHGGPN
jgi:hypothetical protein